MTVAEAFGSESLAIACFAIDFLIWAIASQDRIQRSVAVAAVEAEFVPFLLKQFVFESIQYFDG